jgi:hypothetical protein
MTIKVFFYIAYGCSWFSTKPQDVPKNALMQGTAIVEYPCAPPNRPFGKVQKTIGISDSIYVNGLDWGGWGKLLELEPSVSEGCKNF